MARKDYTKLLKLLNRYKYILVGALVLTLVLIAASLYLYAFDPNTFQEKLADLLMNAGQTILGTIIIGGGLGGVFNFIFEESKAKEEQIRNDLKERQETQEKNKLFRQEMQSKLQQAHDNIELARILIKSHKSGKTYGEQIRNRIMPSLISLQDFKRRLSHAEDRALVKNMDYLQVSLTYMIAYLSVLLEEFEASYLEISNLQNYQDALASHMRALFTKLTEENQGKTTSAEAKKAFLENAEMYFNQLEVPAKMETVWQALEKLHYLSDFIDELRNDRGKRSTYYLYFLLHYFHCLKILKTHNSLVNERLVGKDIFKENMLELQRIEEKKQSNHPLTKQDSLTRKIMKEELYFDFETAQYNPSTQQ